MSRRASVSVAAVVVLPAVGLSPRTSAPRALRRRRQFRQEDGEARKSSPEEHASRELPPPFDAFGRAGPRVNGSKEMKKQRLMKGIESKTVAAFGLPSVRRTEMHAKQLRELLNAHPQRFAHSLHVGPGYRGKHFRICENLDEISWTKQRRGVR